MYDMRADQVGWTVFHVESGRPVKVHDVVLVGLDYGPADEMVALLNRQGRTRKSKRLSDWPFSRAGAFVRPR